MQEAENFINGLGLEQEVSAEQYKTALKSAIKDRALIYYCIWKKLMEMYPEVDADLVLQKASWDFGLIKGNQIAKMIEGTDIGPKEVLKDQTSKGGMLVFEQEIVEFNNDKAVKVFHACPHVEVFRENGATPEEIKKLCRNMLCWGDYGSVAPFENVKLEFPSTIADGDGKGCEMTITKR